MKVVRAENLGSIADYKLVEVHHPSPGAGEVLIAVAACSLGYADILSALGRYQVKPRLPYTPGGEIAGEIVEVGPEVVGLKAGDRVFSTAQRGGLAEIVVSSASDVFRMPPSLSYEQACCLRVNYLTALHGLRDRGNLQPGEKLVVCGASGGVGLAGVQIGKLLGAHVIAAASSDAKRCFALEHGAQVAIDTEVVGWRERLREACGGVGPHVIFDPVCGPLFEAAFRSLSWGGRHLIAGFVGGPIPALPANLALLKGASMVGVDVRQFAILEPHKAKVYVDTLASWVSDRLLLPVVGRIFLLEDFKSALEFAFSGQVMGKTVVRIGDHC